MVHAPLYTGLSVHRVVIGHPVVARHVGDGKAACEVFVQVRVPAFIRWV
jgi:hypothetical protein